MEPLKNTKFLKGNILEDEIKTEVMNYFEAKLDVILSDMAADTTGNKSLDSIRTNQLCINVINFSKDTLKPKGVLVSKLFMGEDFIEVKNLAKSVFKKVNFFKPESSRKESKETYLHCEILKSL
jgi:23S rRNA (uridine2552-2'-O)-methyltransferase